MSLKGHVEEGWQTCSGCQSDTEFPGLSEVSGGA